MVVRNILPAMISFKTYMTGHSHTRQEKPKVVMRSKYFWDKWVERQCSRFWLKDSKIPTLVIKYEDLKSNLKVNLRKMANFLEVKASENKLNCVVKKSEGEFHRKTKNIGCYLEALVPATKKKLKTTYDQVKQWIKEAL